MDSKYIASIREGLCEAFQIILQLALENNCFFIWCFDLRSREWAHLCADDTGAFEPTTSRRRKFPTRSRWKDESHSDVSRAEDGATAIEYALIASLIAVVILGAGQIVGTNISTVFTEVGAALK